MNEPGANRPLAVGVSTSETPDRDMNVVGLGPEHFEDVMAEVALQLLSSGRSVAYGGDPRPNGFVDYLSELVARYRGHPDHDGMVDITDYLAWPVHIGMRADDLGSYMAKHERIARIVLLARDGSRMDSGHRLSLGRQEPDRKEWAEGLTRMRTVMRDETEVRLVLGGQVAGYKGRMPGIAEETLLSLQARQPVFLIGGYGGCSRDIAETMGLTPPWLGSRGDWPGRSEFRKYSRKDLHNGLSDRENEILAETPYMENAMILVLRGLRKITARRRRRNDSNTDEA